MLFQVRREREACPAYSSVIDHNSGKPEIPGGKDIDITANYYGLQIGMVGQKFGAAVGIGRVAPGQYHMKSSSPRFFLLTSSGFQWVAPTAITGTANKMRPAKQNHRSKPVIALMGLDNP